MSTEPAYFSLLATTFIVILGGMLMPAFVAIARTPVVERLVRKVIWSACRACLARGVRIAVAVATATVALTLLLVVVTASPASAQVAARAEANAQTAQSFERLIDILDKAAKHPTAKVARLFARGYTAIRIYRLSKEMSVLKTDIALLHSAVHSILSEVTAVIERVENSPFG